MGYGWEGELVRLAPLVKEQHLENAVTWLNDPEVTAWTLVGDWPITRLMEESYFTRVMGGEGDELTFAVETRDGEHIGFSGMHHIDHRHGAASTGSIIGRKDLWRRGYGSDAAAVRSRYAFEVLGLRLLLSESFADNVASLRMLARSGFREVGRIPKRYFKRGELRDVVLLALDRESWQQP